MIVKLGEDGSITYINKHNNNGMRTGNTLNIMLLAQAYDDDEIGIETTDMDMSVYIMKKNEWGKKIKYRIGYINKEYFSKCFDHSATMPKEQGDAMFKTVDAMIDKKKKKK